MPNSAGKIFKDIEIIQEIHRLQHGVTYEASNDDDTKAAFIKALSAYSSKHRGVTLGTIRNWLGKSPTAPNDNGKRFLQRYVKHIISEGLLASDMDGDARILDRFMRETVPERRTDGRTGADITHRDDTVIDRPVAEWLGNLFVASRRNNRSITNDLFHNGDPEDNEDWSYYLVYRFSTNRGELLKSLLVIQKPDEKFKDFGFNHFVWGGEKKGMNKHVFRECEGAILALEKAYYFLGYNFVVGANKRETEGRLYEKARRDAKKHPNGMGLLSSEYEEITRDNGLFSGVTMTIAAGHQPLVSRIAFLHLGTKATLGHELSDRHADLCELPADGLATDLKNTVRRLRVEFKCDTFGSHLQEAVSNPDWATKGAAALAERILRIIDNTPAWEIIQSSLPNAKRSKPARTRTKLLSRGALETFGTGRPRE